jgi:hypothetical protein
LKPKQLVESQPEALERVMLELVLLVPVVSNHASEPVVFREQLLRLHCRRLNSCQTKLNR